jgi:hypothetical protein
MPWSSLDTVPGGDGRKQRDSETIKCCSQSLPRKVGRKLFWTHVSQAVPLSCKVEKNKAKGLLVART